MNKMPSLNGLRAVSVLIVIVGHCVGMSNNSSLKNFFSSAFGSLFQIFIDGGFGVNVFFIISGYLITTLLIREDIVLGKISLRKFYLRRMLRIFPPLYFLLLFYFVLQLTGIIHLSRLSWISSLTYTKFLYHEDWESGHLWSLGIEEWFYLIWPVSFVLLRKKRYKSFFLILIVLGPVIRWFGSRLVMNDVNAAAYLTFFALVTKGNALAVGCLLALYKDNIIDFLGRKWQLYFYGAVIFLLAIPYIYKIIGSFDLKTFASSKTERTGLIANILISIVLFYSIYGPRNYWYSLLNTKAFDYIGKLSYSLYLWQQFFVMNDKKIWVTQFPQNIVFICGASLFSYYCVEKPFLKLKARFANVRSVK